MSARGSTRQELLVAGGGRMRERCCSARLRRLRRRRRRSSPSGTASPAATRRRCSPSSTRSRSRTPTPGCAWSPSAGRTTTRRSPRRCSAGKGPDVGIMHVDQITMSAAHGVLRPLDDIAGGLGFEEADFAPDVWRAGVYEGKRYGIPLDMHPLGLFYNKAVLEEAGLEARGAAGPRGLRGGARRAQGQGHPGQLGAAVRVHRRLHVPVAAVAVRRRPDQRGRHQGDLELRRRAWRRWSTCAG